MHSTPTFNLATRVVWYTKGPVVNFKRIGTVVLVIPADEPPMVLVRPFCRRNELRVPELGMSRPHESYIIAVPGKTIKHKPRLFWPRVANLHLPCPTCSASGTVPGPAGLEPCPDCLQLGWEKPSRPAKPGEEG